MNGGIDVFHDVFKCTDTGTLDTPREGEPWPQCSPQTSSMFENFKGKARFLQIHFFFFQ